MSRWGGSRFLHLAGSVRARSAIVSMLIVGIAFLLSAIGGVALLRHSLYESAANGAQSEAIDLATFITSRNKVPEHLPMASGEMAAQDVNASGRVVSSSRNIVGQTSIIKIHQPSAKVVTNTGVDLHLLRLANTDLDLDHRFAVSAVRYKNPNVNGTVIVANSLGAADHAVGLVELSLGIALPILSLLVGALVMLFTGWALRPVEVIRSEVDELSANDLHHRVHEPAIEDEIGRLARTMNAMLGRIEASNDRQRQLVADVSHELRNPLAAMQAQLEVAAAHPLADRASLLEGTIEEVKRMSQLVNDLLTLARLDEGVMRLRPTDVDLDELTLLYADRLRSHGRVEVSVRGVNAARIRGDEAQLTRVVANLADNAERFARHRVEFAVARGKDCCNLIVTDDGPGVPRPERQHIFERFVRLDEARTHHGTGAGLGLAIVHEIVAAHGGRVWVEDAEPGSRFVVRLPLSVS